MISLTSSGNLISGYSHFSSPAMDEMKWSIADFSLKRPVDIES
jgi:hypothetical protein